MKKKKSVQVWVHIPGDPQECSAEDRYSNNGVSLLTCDHYSGGKWITVNGAYCVIMISQRNEERVTIKERNE